MSHVASRVRDKVPRPVDKFPDLKLAAPLCYFSWTRQQERLPNAELNTANALGGVHGQLPRCGVVALPCGAMDTQENDNF